MPVSPPNAHGSAPRALILSPDNAIVSEVAQLLAHELPVMAVAVASTCPTRAGAADADLASECRLCFLDVAAWGDAAFTFLATASARFPEAPLIALLPGDDADLILRSLRQGASEFLIRPFTADQLQAALRKLGRTCAAALAPEPRGKALCVMPGKGASGASTLAYNLAWHLKRARPGKLLLADMDPLTGTLAFVLKLKSNYSFVDVLARAASLDAEMWKAVVTAWQGVDVLLSPESPVDGMTEASDPTPVLHYSRQAYETVILDAAGPFGEWNLSIADQCDELVLVTTNELPALHATQRAIAYLEANGLKRSKLRLVLNRHSPNVGLQGEDIRLALDSEIFDTLPSDPEVIQKALIDARPALPGSKFGKSIAELAARLAGREEPARKRSLWSGLFGALHC